jgi:hypothetical protein
MRLYKYTSINNYSLNSLEGTNLYFSDPSDYNDVFEFTFNEIDEQIIEQWKKSIKDNNPEKYNLALSALNIELKNRNNPSYNKVVCLSETYKEPLMWAHYANSGKGFCLEFETEQHNEMEWIGFKSCNFKNYKTLENNDRNNDSTYLLNISKVVYRESPPRFLEKLKNGFFKYSKHDKWSYEKEWRIIVTSENLKTQILEYEKSYLKSIIFGTNTSNEHIEKIKEIASRNYKMNDIKYYQIYKLEKSYKLEKREI